jgi:hypothetical protein
MTQYLKQINLVKIKDKKPKIKKEFYEKVKKDKEEYE